MRIEDLLVDLAACLCAQIDTDDSPTPCFCGVVPGDGPSLTYATNCEDRDGMAWVRLNNLYPSSAVGSQNTEAGNCNAGLGADIEMGIMRAVPIEGDGEQVEAEVLKDLAVQSAKDALTMHRAILCCSSLRSKDFIIGMWVPAGPLGLLVGGALTINVGL